MRRIDALEASFEEVCHSIMQLEAQIVHLVKRTQRMMEITKQAQWRHQQEVIASRVNEKDIHPSWNATSDGITGLKIIVGTDISFFKTGNEAIGCIVALHYPSLEVAYTLMERTTMPEPYIPGFLAFREAPILERLLKRLMSERSDLIPDVVLVDGNGVLHPARCGLASHLGVLTGLCTIGVGKKIHAVDGLEASAVRQQMRYADISGELATIIPLKGDSGRIWGAALARCPTTDNPIYVSCGHNVSLPSAIAVVSHLMKYRIPEYVQ